MSYTDFMGWLAGLMQVGVAVYGLRLGRRHGTARVGVWLFSLFCLLALVHAIVNPSGQFLRMEIKVDLIYAVFSVLLLLYMAHVDRLLEERERLRKIEQEVWANLELRVNKRTAQLIEANEKLAAELDVQRRSFPQPAALT